MGAKCLHELRTHIRAFFGFRNSDFARARRAITAYRDQAARVIAIHQGHKTRITNTNAQIKLVRGFLRVGSQ